MKKQHLIFVIATMFAITFCVQQTNAQDGMDYAGLPISHYSKLRMDWLNPNPIPFNTFRDRDNEKAIGVFTELNLLPQSALEINTDFTHMANYLTLWYNRGEVFRTDCPTGLDTWWRLQRNATEMGAIFSRGLGGTVIDRNNLSVQASQNDITFHTQPLTAGIGQERMRVVGVNRTLWPANIITTYPVSAGNVGIGTQSPSAMLQIGGDVTWGGGYRDWMNIGTFYQFGSDNMYTGYRNTSGDALINWGNNPTIGGPDRLLFVFTAATNITPTPPFASGVNGLEGARMVTNGNQFFIGFGGDPNNPSQNPYTANPDPGNTVEINSPAIALGPFNSGLRFTDVNNTVVPPANTTTGVLSLDNIGNVIWVRGGGTVNNADNGLSLNPGNLADVQLGNQANLGLTTAQLLNDREIPMGDYDLIFTGTNPIKNRIGIGMATTTSLSPEIKLEVKGSISLNDGNGNTSLFFGREQPTLVPPATDYGEWGVQYVATVSPFAGGLHFWKPWGSDNSSGGNGYGNYFLFLCDNGNVGIGGTPNPYTSAPVNTLEIYSNVPATTLNPITAVSPTRSGLRFKNLTATTMPVDGTANSTGTVLSVNDDGDVILVQGAASPFFQCGVSNSAAQLPNDSWFQLNGRNFIFADGPNAGSNNVGIGTGCTPIAKFQVENYVENNTASFITNTTANPPASDVYGVWAQTSGSLQVNYGVYSAGIGNTALANIGVDGIARYATMINYGGLFNADNNGTSYPNTNYGINCFAKDGAMNYGIWAKAPVNSIQIPGGFPSGTNFAGYFDGDVVRTGTDNFLSDINMKENIYSISNALDKIKHLSPSKFNFRTTQYPQMSLPNGLQFGLIAQNVDTVIPELVKDIIYPAVLDSVGNVIYPEMTFKGLNYIGLIPIAIEAIKELDSAITNMSAAAENGLHIDTAAFGNPVKMGGVINESTTIGLKKNLLFASDNSYTGQVCIGSPTAAPNEALMVNNKTWMTSAKFINNKISTTNNIAASFEATGSPNMNYGSQFLGKGDGNLSNYGATFEATGHSKTNYGVYATASGGSMADYAGYFNGNLYASSYLNLPSDSKLKENIQPISDAMAIIDQLQPKTFTFKAASFPSIHLVGGQQFGLIAQDVEPILPTLVSTTIHPAVFDSAGTMLYDTVQSKSLNYEAFIPILIQGMKEEHSTIDSLKSQITDLQNQVAQLSGNNGSNEKILNSINIELANDAVLYQNIPNPFGEETMINYYIPENTGNAKIIFFDMYGQSMKDVPLTQTGSGNIHVDSKNLASGIYSYSLIINGKVIDTKKMVRNK